jgi:hypothetical protein
MLLQSLEEGCAEEALSVAAMLNVQQVFMMPKGKAAKEEALGAWKELAVAEGDHYTLVNVYRTSFILYPLPFTLYPVPCTLYPLPQVPRFLFSYQLYIIGYYINGVVAS